MREVSSYKLGWFVQSIRQSINKSLNDTWIPANCMIHTVPCSWKTLWVFVSIYISKEAAIGLQMLQPFNFVRCHGTIPPSHFSICVLKPTHYACFYYWILKFRNICCKLKDSIINFGWSKKNRRKKRRILHQFCVLSLSWILVADYYNWRT